MNHQIDNRVVVICRDDERAWRPRSVDGQPIGSYAIEIDPSTKMIRSERNSEHCLHSFSHSHDGTRIELSSEGKGVIALDSIEWPRSTLAVVRLISAQGDDDIHLVEGVKADDLTSYSWGLDNKLRFQLFRDPEPPAGWEGTRNDWHQSHTYQAHQQGFERRLQQEFAAALQALSIHISPDNQREFDEFITQTCAQNPGWFWEIRRASTIYALQGTFSQEVLSRIVYLSQEGIDPHDLSFRPSVQQTIKALFDHCKQTAKLLSNQEIWDTQAQCDLLTAHELMRIVQTNATHKPFFYRWLWRMEGRPDPILIENPDLYEIYRDELIADRDKILAAFGIDGALEVDYRDQVINSLLRDDGWTLVETDRFEEEEQRRRANGA